MRIDIDNWRPITVSELNKIFSNLPIIWGIAGGWALDLHQGKQTRAHSDIDVIITRADQLKVFTYLSPRWILYRAESGRLTRWSGEYLNSTDDIWVSRDEKSPWAFQIMIIETEEDRWFYKRKNIIHRPINELFLTTTDGIPYLKPEIQLLYKGGSSQIREKDLIDLENTLPVLESQEKEWLKSALRLQFPQGHDWIEYI
ncbi:hypothetical protein MHI24_00125 [Paenibacillus sp. FSL K6-1096]|uniref:nucleotidyltransferase domain-containing protein n=1 Tax=Paenibacillus sp. FSL K6-1096 TaxID=2921460 RepID=UPI0030EF9508